MIQCLEALNVKASQLPDALFRAPPFGIARHANRILRYFGVQFAIEDAIGMPVDLVTEDALRAELRPFVERDRIRV